MYSRAITLISDPLKAHYALGALLVWTWSETCLPVSLLRASIGGWGWAWEDSEKERSGHIFKFLLTVCILL